MRQLTLLVTALLALVACQPEQPETLERKNALLDGDFMLSQSSFNSLSKEDQYMVANKILAPMMKGIAVDDFFETSNGLDNLNVKATNFVNNTLSALNTDLSTAQINAINQDIFGYDLLNDDGTPMMDEDGNTLSVQSKYRFDGSEPQQQLVARMYEMPISKNQFNAWMAYFLANTIMFSPAREMESTDSNDVYTVLSFLETELSAETPIRDIIRKWMPRQSRFRVARSPENQVLEIKENYLGIFNDLPEEIADTQSGAQACSEYYLTDDSEDYTLRSDPANKNTTQVLFQGYYVTTCEEVYDIVAGHPNVIPRVTEVLINYFLSGRPQSARHSLRNAIVEQEPTTFKQIFTGIIFSREFLLNTRRPKSFEENAMAFLHRAHWNAQANSGNMNRDGIRNVFASRSNNFRTNDKKNMTNMGQAPMEYKIGRYPDVPMDVLSFAAYHKAMREDILISQSSWSGSRHPDENDELFPVYDGALYEAGWEKLKPSIENFDAEDLINFTFLMTLGRKATTEESITFDYISDSGGNNQPAATTVTGELEFFLMEGLRRGKFYTDDDDSICIRTDNGRCDGEREYNADDIMEIMLDYISRLPEFYYFSTVQ